MLGFLSDNFGEQGGSNETIDMCIDTYGLTFQQFAIDHVIDPDAGGPLEPQPVWDWMAMQTNWVAPDWNFHKYLIARDGTLLQHYGRFSYPANNNIDPDSADWQAWEIVVDVETEIAKPVPEF